MALFALFPADCICSGDCPSNLTELNIGACLPVVVFFDLFTVSPCTLGPLSYFPCRFTHHIPSCATHSYHCPNLGKDGYPKWNPPNVSSGSCKPKDVETLKQEPFPPGFKVLFFGNSHIRQASVARPTPPFPMASKKAYRLRSMYICINP